MRRITIFSLLALLLMVATSAMAQEHNVELNDDSEVADKWIIRPKKAEKGQVVTVTYNGSKRVKSVKVVKPKFEIRVASDPENDYFSGSKSFTPDEIAAALGLASAEDLENLIEGGNNVYLKSPDGSLNDVYTGNHNEFWLNAKGEAQGYGDDGTCWYIGLYYQKAGIDYETGESYPAAVVIKMGQMPNYFKRIYTDSYLSATLVLSANGVDVSFGFRLHVNAAHPDAGTAYGNGQ